MAITVQALLNRATTQLAAANIATARLDVMVLLEDCLRTNRALLLAHPETDLTAEQLSILDKQISRRARHEPLAYIRGRSEFYGHMFSVNKNVLVPRPESETMIELLKKLPPDARTVIIDVGTGSGALAISAKLELPEAQVFGIDIDAGCLKIAGQNAAALAADITWLEGDLLTPLAEKSSPSTVPAPNLSRATLLCNLPYIPDGYQINQAAGYEPRLALFAGTDGLDLYRQLFRQQASDSWRSLHILTESLPEQHDKLKDIAASHGYTLTATNDFIQLFTSTP